MAQKELPKFAQDLLHRVIKENGFTDYLMDIKNGSQIGDGFQSEIFGIAIVEHNSDKKLDLVCKVAPFNEKQRKEFQSRYVFNREAHFYNKIAPMFAKFQEEKNVPKENQFLAYAKCYATLIDDDNEQYAIILENLRPQGFGMWNRAKVVPIETVSLVMQELGKMHGISIAMKDQKPEEFAVIKPIKEIIFMHSESMQTLFKISFDRTINSLKNEDHKNIMRHIRNNIIAYAKDIFDDKISDQFGVLCHGDFSNNNILFQFENDNIAKDIRILDWQTNRYVSPAIDILINIFTSTDKALRDKEYDNLLELYHKSLSKTVQSFGSKPNELFTLENLKDEMKRCGNHVLMFTPIYFESFLADSSETGSFDEMFDSLAKGENTRTLITGLSDEGQREFERRMTEVLEDFIRLGYYHKVDTE